MGSSCLSGMLGNKGKNLEESIESGSSSCALPWRVLKSSWRSVVAWQVSPPCHPLQARCTGRALLISQQLL